MDDDEAIRHSASFMLRHAGFTVRTYRDGVHFLDELDPAQAGCILLDVRMPVLDGIAVLGALSERGIDMPVVVLTGHGDVSVAVDAMKAGAIDFIEKPYEKQVLLEAINAAFDRLDDTVAQRTRETKARALLAVLTPRERDVLERLVEGMTNKTIAADLSISARTVEIHRGHLMEKLGADSLSAALKTAFQAGIGLEDHK
ncbi:DNA-binding response regulator FixJ [Hyphomonas johnsonii MHS-2]|uniref:DNA-binding response regulator FixJ n=1 Tax=Hyphomonas johnsonii MHS-2 TaxID=1280950 RepID=A0A059FRU8_9PROT|nr:response regulator [Hyphomonas johnsonii]KCZ93395.1 DNA-binding response regulator FixJ [Hyphomonas johnsonii MHS-2]